MAQDKPNSSTVGSVSALHGGVVNTPTPNDGAIAEAMKLLEQCEAGEVTGFVVAKLHGDNLASYTISGMAGPYSLLGSVDMAKRELQNIMQGEYE